MPELPEVETICRSLSFLQGRSTHSAHFSPLAPIEKTTPDALLQLFHQSSLQKIERRGKYLLLTTPLGSLVVHLGMTGQLRFFPKPSPEPPHSHLTIRFNDNSRLLYIDARRFGTLSLTRENSGEDNPFLLRLGPDYDSHKLNPEDFLKRCRRHGGLSLKSLALNQGVAAGLGNIYACEALYEAGLSPKRLVRRTKDVELLRFLKAARSVLSRGIAKGGSSLRDYFDGLGNRGVMKEFLQVYDREGLATLDGRGKVKRIVQNARSTWYCPEVQK